MDQDLKQLTPVDISKVWETEPQHFTPWLAREENLTLLGEALKQFSVLKLRFRSP